MKHERSIVSIKQIHHSALKDISEVLEQNYITQKIKVKHIEYSNNFRIMCVSIKRCVQKILLWKLTNKDSNHTRRSKQNTYHVVNKNIAPSKVTDRSRRKRGCLPGHPQALAFWCP